MKTRAAVAWEPGKPLEVQEVELDGLPGWVKSLLEMLQLEFATLTPTLSQVQIRRVFSL